MSKYKARAVVLDGIRFDSLAESVRYMELRLLERGGVISGLIVHHPFDLMVNGVRVGAYISDFVYGVPETKTMVLEDVKGFRTPVYKLKKKIMEAMGHTITEVKPARVITAADLAKPKKKTSPRRAAVRRGVRG